MGPAGSGTTQGRFDLPLVQRRTRHHLHRACPETDQCILWTGPGGGIDGTHIWTFRRASGGTLVHTEESWSGTPVTKDPTKATSTLDTGLAARCADLKKVVEAHQHR